MRPPGEGHLDAGAANLNGAFSFDEVPEELGGVALLESAEAACQHRIEGVGDHRESDIEADLDEDRGGKGVEVEELHGLGDAVLHPPPPSVVADEQFDR